ncbi:putative glycosyl hydrolase family 10 protein 1 [Elsinoe fawcettii]|nr:putative glycosyl hydrolase family 10 protein 1 [Elsinoe fawcettii]
MGGGLNANLFYNVLGSGYVAEAFRVAREVALAAKLYLNENQVESRPGKRRELFDQVSQLVAEGVPIDWIASQIHLGALGPNMIKEMADFLNGLGLELGIAEMD